MQPKRGAGESNGQRQASGPALGLRRTYELSPMRKRPNSQVEEKRAAGKRLVNIGICAAVPVPGLPPEIPPLRVLRQDPRTRPASGGEIRAGSALSSTLISKTAPTAKRPPRLAKDFHTGTRLITIGRTDAVNALWPVFLRVGPSYTGRPEIARQVPDK